MKIICVGLNYPAHCRELHEEQPLPAEPVIFLKPDSALLRLGNPFFLPDFAERFDYETELVVRISRLGRFIAPQFAHRYYDSLTVGIDFTARDLQSRLRRDALPWELSKGFDGSAAHGRFISTEEIGDVQQLSFRLDIDGETVQQGNTADMIFSVDQIISYVSRFFTLKMGDLIYTGTPLGVGPVHVGNHLQGYLNEQKLLDFYVR